MDENKIVAATLASGLAQNFIKGIPHEEAPRVIVELYGQCLQALKESPAG